MEDPDKTGTPTGAETSDKAGGVDLDAAAAKYRREAKRATSEAEKLKADLESANARLAEIEEAKKSETQKQLEAAIKKTQTEKDAEWAAKVKELEIKHALASHLKDRGYPSKLAALIETTAPAYSIEDIPAAVDSVLNEMGWPKSIAPGSRIPGFPGSPDPVTTRDDSPWDSARIARSTPEEINKNWDKIKAAQAAGQLRMR